MSRRVLSSLCIGAMAMFIALSASADERWSPHGRDYPRRGVIVHELPRERVLVYDRFHHPFYQYGGAWYAPRRAGFVVVGPPVGVFVSVLPASYSTLWFGGVPYYYANDTYYMWREREHSYEVVDPPQGSSSNAPAAQPSGDVFVYPKNGQSDEQISRDRYDCHRWAVNETGFDPTQSGGNVPEEERANKRVDYQRAESACLEGRGYTVK